MATEKPSAETWLAEYKAYRSELLELVKQRYYILAITVSAIGVALGFASRATAPGIVFLIPVIAFVFLFSFASITYYISEQYHRITAYLEVFVEPNLGLERERAWDIHHHLFRHVAFTRPIMQAYAALIFISGIFPLIDYGRRYLEGSPVRVLLPSHLQLAIAIAVAFVSLAVAAWFWRRWVSAPKRSEAKKNWEQVKIKMASPKGQQ